MNTAAELDLYQDVVMDHKRKPRHFGALAAPTHRARGRNPSCGDDVQLTLDVAQGQVRDIGFSGQGCAICIASTSMMAEAVCRRDIAVAQQLQRRFRAVLTGELEPEGAQLGKLISLAGVRRYPARIKCALLGWHALMHALGAPDEVADAGAEIGPDPTQATP